VAIYRHALRLGLRERGVTQRGDRAHVRHRNDGADGGRLVGHDDGRGALDRHHLAALHALSGSLFRRTYQHGEE
jgi:hypothetical protein